MFYKKRFYKVIKGSDDGTFLPGDTIIKCENGEIECSQAGGWIPSDEVEEATKGMIAIPWPIDVLDETLILCLGVFSLFIGIVILFVK